MVQKKEQRGWWDGRNDDELFTGYLLRRASFFQASPRTPRLPRPLRLLCANRGHLSPLHTHTPRSPFQTGKQKGQIETPTRHLAQPMNLYDQRARAL